MTATVASAAVRAKQFQDTFFTEYVRDSRFKRYMGSGENAIFQVNRDLSKKKGDAITFNLVGALDASSYNDGSSALVGNEVALPNDGFQLTVGVVRQATVVNVMEDQASAFDIKQAARTSLKLLAMTLLKNAIVSALGSINGVAFGTANATQRNAWTAANVDRVLFGSAIANYNATHATALNNVTVGMTLNRATVSLLKRRAQSAKNVNGNGIRPFVYGEDEETYVLFAGVGSYRDLKADLSTVFENARERANTNPLFTGTTSLYWDGVVIREIPEIAGFNNTAATPIPVAPVYLCGAQALAIGWAKTTQIVLRKEDDYEFQRGVGFMEIRGVAKITYGQSGTPKDWGMVTGFVAAAPDA
jgi:hypothetical protein